MTNLPGSPEARASELLSYVCRHGEADPAGPKSADIADAIKRYDGSCESEDRIWNAYRTTILEAE